MSTQVTLQHVDLENSYLSGYLQINGLTDDFPVLITFFDGEIISEKHPFLTRYGLTVIRIKKILHLLVFSVIKKYPFKFNHSNSLNKQLKFTNIKIKGIGGGEIIGLSLFGEEY